MFDGSLAPGEQDLESKMIPTLERVRCVEDALLVSDARISTNSSDHCSEGMRRLQ